MLPRWFFTYNLPKGLKKGYGRYLKEGIVLETATRENFVKRKLVNPLLALLKAGITPEKLSLTVSLGAIIGLIPAFGVTTLIGTVVAARFRLNSPILLLISYFVNPIQIIIALPLVKLGIYIFGGAPLHYSLSQVMHMFRKDWLETINKLWVANLLGIAAWAMLAIPLGFMVYYLTLPVFRKFVLTTKYQYVILMSSICHPFTLMNYP